MEVHNFTQLLSMLLMTIPAVRDYFHTIGKPLLQCAHGVEGDL